MIKALQQSVNSPNNNQVQTNLAQSRDDLISNLRASRINTFSPAWKQTLEEIGFSEFAADSLAEKIEEIFLLNSITPASALNSIQELQKNFTKFKSGFDSIINGFNSLGIQADDIDPGSTEIGFQIPRELIENDLENLSKEIKEIVFILNSLVELVTGKKESYQISSLSTSDPLITITTETINWVLAFGVSINWLMGKYKELLEIRLLRSQLKEKGLKDENLTGIDDHANSVMEKAIEELIEKINDEHAIKTDKGRNNELKNSLRIGFNKLVNRIDGGYNIEIRVKPIENDQEINEGKKSNVEQVQEISKNLRYNNVTGKGILSLPEKKTKS